MLQSILRGLDLHLGDEQMGITSALTAQLNTAVSDQSFSADMDTELCYEFYGGNSVAVLIDDDKTDTDTDETVLDLDAAEDSHANSAADGNLDDANVDTIRFTDDGTTANDIGAVIIMNFKTVQRMCTVR